MATFTVDGTKTTVSFEYTALTAKIQEVIGACAENLWVEETDEEGEVTNPFADATNTEKLNIVDEYIKDIIVNRANQFKLDKAKDAVEVEEHVIE